jgi:hypothetical protein
MVAFLVTNVGEQNGERERLHFRRFDGYTVGMVVGVSGSFVMVRRRVTLVR